MKLIEANKGGAHMRLGTVVGIIAVTILVLALWHVGQAVAAQTGTFLP